MGNFNRNRDRKSGGSRGRDRDRGGFRGRDRDNRQIMHQAVCDSCGNNCEVPFRPTSGKPIYCNDCFRKSDNRSGGRSYRSVDRGQNNEKLTEAIDNLNKKLDKIFTILETPVVEKKEVKAKAKAKVSKSKSKTAKEKTKPKTKAQSKPKATKAKKLAKKKK